MEVIEWLYMIFLKFFEGIWILFEFKFYYFLFLGLLIWVLVIVLLKFRCYKLVISNVYSLFWLL